MNQKPFMYVTNPETYIIYKYEYQNGQYVKKSPYIPVEFELMNVKQQQAYRQKKALQFMVWSMLNKQQFNNPIDHRIILCRIIDVNTNILMAILSTLGLKHFLIKLNSPFMDYYFEDKFITFLGIKKLVSYMYFGFALYYGIRNVANQEHIFDLSLEYQ